MLEADYSVCLQLLLKYPPPDPSHGPHTFVDDALYLRDHANAAGGSTLIMKYTGKQPEPPGTLAATSATTTSRLDSLRQRATLRSGSPLPSPSRFIQQQQGGMETLIQGAAKGARGVFERGEKLGINQAVREAMGELRRNMQSFNEARQSGGSKVASDEAASSALAAMEQRNRQLASFLDQTVVDLKTLSASSLEDKAKSLEMLEVVAAKVQFVQVHLVDASMDLPELTAEGSEQTQSKTEGAKPKAQDPKAATQKTPSQTIPSQKAKKQPEVLPDQLPVSSLKIADSKPRAKPQPAPPPQAKSAPAPPADAMDTSEDASTPKQPEAKAASKAASETMQQQITDENAPQPEAATTPPPPPPPPKQTIPRSTIAQSSFSWMLEPDESTPSKPTTSSSHSPATDKSPSSSQHKKRGSNNVNRERNAFLFGEVANDGDGGDALRSDQIFGLESIQKGKAGGSIFDK